MPLFGKPKKTELEAAVEFVQDVCLQAQAQWPAICASFEPLESQFASYRDDKIAAYEFMIAAISVQLQAVSNLLPPDQGSRIRAHVLECLINDDVGDYARMAIAAYDAEWDKSMAQEEVPSNGVACLLYDKIGLSNSVTVDGDAFKNPFLIMTLGMVIVQFGGAWWKNYIERNRIVA
ncbi:hypothetical protein JXA32_01770 [Candidatus Sumerlaeota bacterium]|nr:hypothetical protein [Candidatus Sumerlaeota bacterium]